MLFVAGTDDVVESVWKSIPDKTRVHATCLTSDYARGGSGCIGGHSWTNSPVWSARWDWQPEPSSTVVSRVTQSLPLRRSRAVISS